MDNNLTALLDRMLRTWVITDPGIYGSQVDNVETHIEELFGIYVQEFSVEFPAMFGRTYLNYVLGTKIFTEDINAKMLNLLCSIRLTNNMFSRLVPIDYTSGGSGVFDLSETTTAELYAELAQNDWNSELEHPVILYDDTLDKDYIQLNNTQFVLFGFKERKMDVERVPHHIWRPLKYFLEMKIAEVVHDALTKYALEKGIALAEKTAATESSSTGNSITPDQISSVHIGNLSLSLMSSNSWSRVSDLLGSGAGQSYLQQLKDIAKTNQDKFNREKFIRYSGMTR